MPTIRSLAFAALLATPAVADPAADYAKLRASMPTILFGNNVDLQLQLQAEVLKRLEGRWTLVTPLMADGVTFPDRQMIAKACEQTGYDVAPDGNFGLTLALPTKTAPYVVTLRYAGGTTYLSTLDEAGMMARLFPGKSLQELQPGLIYNTIVTSSWQGYVSLMPLGDDLVLLRPLSRAPELLARCP